MHQPRGVPSLVSAAARLLACVLLGAGVLLVGAPSSIGADGISLESTSLLGGNVRAGGWVAVQVNVSNDGPDMRGELRIRSQQQGRSIHAVEADLPSGARKQFVLYAQVPFFGTRLVVELVSGDTAVASQDVQIRSRDGYTALVAIIAERPEAFQRDIGDALNNPNVSAPQVVTLRPEELPTRVEALASLDRLIWQDVDTSRLTPEQVAALELWVDAGGQLVIVGGSTGPGTLSGFPAEMLPFVPDRTVDVSGADLGELLGPLPVNATSLPALAGTLTQGMVLGRSGDAVYAARTSRGQGAVTIIGVDPGASWLARSDTAGGLWRRALPAVQGQFQNPFFLPDEYNLFQQAMSNLPSVSLPPIDQLFVLLVAYIALIGPVNYLVLRRLDRREWAWLTMPILVGVFAVGSYALGASLKGSDVIINEVAIVRAGQDSTRGMGQVYVGVFSPSRRTFEVRVPGGALLSSPSSQNFGQAEQPIDALHGDTTSRLRNFEVGFGVIRGFRADVPVDTPQVRADLRLVSGRITGTVTNASDAALENVAVVFGGAVVAIPSLAAGETREVDMRPVNTSNNWYSLSERVFGTSFSRDPQVQRKLTTRRAVIDQITGYGPTIIGGSRDLALVLGWREGVALDVELDGERPNRVGDALYVVPVPVTYDRQAVFENTLLVRTIVDQGSEQGWAEGDSYTLDRGTMTIEFRPAGLAQRFRPTSVELGVSQGSFINLRGAGELISPLPDEEQPPQDAPLGAATGDGAGTGGAGGAGLPKPAMEPWMGNALPIVQVLDHRAGTWYELPELKDGRGYKIDQPGRWVDDTGRLLVRLVNRHEQQEMIWFQMQARMEGTIE
ncbi:hypothetical protein BH23CHL7_BH23CHL7_08780 [soil metagenome]